MTPRLTQGREFWGWILGILVMEALSMFLISSKDTSFFISMILAVGLFFITVRRPILGLGIIMVEYLIGSFGHLLPALRFWFFIAFILGWFVWAIKNKNWRKWKEYLPGRKKYVVLAVLCVYAFLIGWLRGNAEFLFVDANAWMVWFLVLPVIDIAAHHSNIINRLTVPVLTSLVWLGVKTTITFYLFSHQLAYLHGWFYTWIRDTRIGEITKITNHAYRIFFQSHIYLVIALIFVLAFFLFRQPFVRMHWRVAAFGSFLGAAILISLSRSFWLGMGAAILLLLGYAAVWTINQALAHSSTVDKMIVLTRNFNRQLRVRIFMWLLMGLGSLLIVFALTILPPKSDSHAIIDMVHARSSAAEPAALSRWQLLPILWEKVQQHPILGSGFGATVSYKSFDPRFALTGGQVTTYAFEWGWLDIWIKFGIAGIIVMLWLLWSIAYRLWKSSEPHWIRVAGLASIVALIVIHMFTPYLNHPLGIFALIMAEGFLIRTEHRPEERAESG